MKIIKTIIRELACIIVAFLVGGIGYLIGHIIASWLMDEYRDTGGVILASEMVQFKIIPIIGAIIGAIVGWFLQRANNA